MNEQALFYLSLCAAFNSDDKEDEEIIQCVVDETLLCLRLVIDGTWNEGL